MKNTFGKIWSSKSRTVAGLLTAAALTTLTACTITRHSDGTVTVTDAPQDSKNGTYTQIDIGGKCFLSNNEWCIPCGGGTMKKCSDIRDILESPKPWNPNPAPTNPTNPTTKPSGSAASASAIARGDGGAVEGQSDFGPGGKSGFQYLGEVGEVPSDEMISSFKEMTDGMDWEMIPYAYNMFGWGEFEPHGTDFSLNYYNSDSGVVDITYLSEFKSYTATPGQWLDPQGRPFTVEILYAGGDPNDNIPDPIGVRLRGHRDSVAYVLKGSMGDFAGSIDVDNHHVDTTIVRAPNGIGTLSVYVDGVLSYRR